jgi:hypothetical protein
MVEKRIPVRLIFGVGDIRTSLGGTSGECGGWVMRGEFVSVRNRCATGDMWLERYRDAETAVPATGRAVSSELLGATSARLARRNDQ